MTEYLLTGGNGVLGSALIDKFNQYKIDCAYPSKEELDVTKIDTIRNWLTPDINYFIHCAAKTSVEQCETNKKTAYDVNVNGTDNVLKVLKNTHVKLIYISTPCVFNGDEDSHDERSLPQPDNYYGLTKTIAEELILRSGVPHLILRTNFVGRKPWPYPKAFTDRFGNYLFADEVADEIIRRRNMFGIQHVIGMSAMSMFELAQHVSPEVKPMTLDDYNGKAKLTKNMVMRTLYD